ncbi:hypothetical protein L210DRAFT_3544685 [Boletus edulis BED1]|uniref:Uncharacterized protein n=1 Tax=Boletus edulis BED1 TaxID=1328754 RepID=A0AAD4BS89_BOLED|nr:hypothetical protein L210DRAFT_3544685 [Boletus edulis BED1]
MAIAQSLDRADSWPTRMVIALVFARLTPFFLETQVEPLFHIRGTWKICSHRTMMPSLYRSNMLYPLYNCFSLLGQSLFAYPTV